MHGLLGRISVPFCRVVFAKAKISTDDASNLILGRREDGISTRYLQPFSLIRGIRVGGIGGTDVMNTLVLVLAFHRLRLEADDIRIQTFRTYTPPHDELTGKWRPSKRKTRLYSTRLYVLPLVSVNTPLHLQPEEPLLL